jgi:glycosyltransferase involved in cell wall biosynthesis
LFSGKLSPRKGPDLLLEAIKQLPPEERAASLVLFLGSGEMQENLRQQAQHEPAVDVVFAGFQNQTRLSAYYHAADLLVLPSQRSETWGLVVNEALFHGLPCVVSTGVGCGPDLIVPGVTGEIFRSGSVAELASAITRATALIGRAEVRDQCRAAVSRYSVERAAAGIADAYAAVAQRAA